MLREFSLKVCCGIVFMLVASIVFVSIRHYYEDFLTPFAIAIGCGGAADILTYIVFVWTSGGRKMP